MAVQAIWNLETLLLFGAPEPMEAADLRQFVVDHSGDSLLALAPHQVCIRLWIPRDGTLVPQALEALAFLPSEAVDVLTSLEACAESTLSDSLHYWARLARWVIDHLARQQFYPWIDRRNQTWQAPWRVLIGNADRVDQLHRYAASMPPVCRALVNGVPPDPWTVVESFLHATSDALIRRAVSNDPFFARVHTLSASPDSASDLRWLSALLGNNPIVRGNGDLPELAQAVNDWISVLHDSGQESAWTLGLELIEPELSDQAEQSLSLVDAPWKLVLKLHPHEDELQPVAASCLWTETSALPGTVGGKLAERREHLLAEIERASSVCPPLSRLLTDPCPTELSLTTAEAYQFLRQWSVALREKSFVVVLPDWSISSEDRLGLLMDLSPLEEDEDLLEQQAEAAMAAASIAPATGRMGLDSVLRFNWRISLGGVELAPEEFAKLVSAQTPLLRYKGRWIELDPDAARAALDFLKNKPSGTVTFREALRAAHGLAPDTGALPLLGITGSDWIRHLLEQSPARQMQHIVQPHSFVGTLRPYQLRGLQWLAFLDNLGIGACLADDMGLGKTIQLIALLLHERDNDAPPGQHPTLLFAPTSVVGNWVKELRRFAPSLSTMLHHGPLRLHGKEFADKARRHDVVITSYALAYRDVEDFRSVAWHRIALDEAQKIKNPSAASSMAIRSLQAPHRVALTGTPIENHLSELWSIMDMLNPGLLGTVREFRERFAVPIEKLGDQERGVRLKRMIRPFVLRRTKDDPELAGDLPEKMETKVFCSLTPEQAAMYERITADMLMQIDAATGIRRRGLILAVLTRLKQICDHPSLLIRDDRRSPDDRSGKAERLIDMLEEVIEEGQCALVFTQYREMGHLLERMIQRRLGTRPLFLHGGTPQKMREQMVLDFQTPGGATRVFILSLRAGGLGLNLTRASHVFHYDRWWNPAVEAQATDRAHRIGQTQRVQVHKFVALGTVEERIDKLLSEKTALAENIVGSGDEWLTNLSTAELREYLTLSHDAVAELE